MLQSFFVLSGQHTDLARDEIVAISKSYDRRVTSNYKPRLVVINSNVPWQKIYARATFVRAAGQLIDSYDDLSAIYPKLKPKTFACSAINLSRKKISRTVVEREAGAIVKEMLHSKVSLIEPSIVIYMIFTDDKMYLGLSEPQIQTTRPRKISKYPTELDWKTSRCMVNLSRLREGEILCDPFCGTGTIPLEAESMGIQSIGMDFDPHMCLLTKRNLEANHYGGVVINSTYHHLPIISGGVNAIVTDLPYGISSRSSVRPKVIVRDFLSTIPKKMRLVMVYKKGADVDELSNAKKYEIYRHKSLTRVIVVK